VLKRRDTLDSSIDSSRASSPALSVSTESGIVTIGYEDGLASVTSFSFPDTSRSVSSKSIEVSVQKVPQEISHTFRSFLFCLVSSLITTIGHFSDKTGHYVRTLDISAVRNLDSPESTLNMSENKWVTNFFVC
jgi:hypothetical protein